MKKYIHFMKLKGKNFIFFTENGTITNKSENFQVSNLKEAQAIAIKRNLIPFNFSLKKANKKKKDWTAKNYFKR